MKNRFKLIFITLLLIVSFEVKSQSWNQLISGTSENLNSVHFANDKVGFVAGDNGVLLKTTDGGITWNDIFNISNINFQSVFAIDADTLYISGNAKLYKSVDGGINWIDLNQNFDITKVYFVTPQHGYYYRKIGVLCEWSGGSITWYHLELFETNDYGKTWTNTNLPNFEHDNIQFTSDRVGYIISEQFSCCGIHCSPYSNPIGYKTTNGGVSWQDLDIDYWLEHDRAYFLNDTIGYFMDYHSIERTIDGTNSFQTIFSGDNNPLTNNPAHFEYVNQYEGYIIRDKTIYISTSCGVNWGIDYSGTTNLLAADFIDTTCAYVTGQYGLILQKELHPASIPDSIKTVEIIPDSIDFGKTGINKIVNKSINIRNSGTLDLEVSLNISSGFTIKLSTDSLYSMSIDTFILNSFQSVTVDVLFQPAEDRLYKDDIIVYSNSDNLPIDTIQVTGEGVINGISGTFTNDTTLCVDIIRVIGDITVSEGATLTICPGTVIEFQNSHSFTVNGKLIAIGTPNDPIVFTWGHDHIKWKNIHIEDNLIDTSYIKYCIIEHASESGIYVEQSNAIISNCKIRYNRNGIFLDWSNYSEIRNNYIHDNKYTSSYHAYGIGIRSDQSNAIIAGNYIFNNSLSSGSGGGGGLEIHTMTNNKVCVNQNLIFNNSSIPFEGGGIDLSALDNSEISLMNNIIVNNTGLNGISYWRKYLTSSIKIYNCIIRNNTGCEIDTSNNDEYYPIEIMYSNVERGFPGRGNIDKDPQFVNPTPQIGPLTSGFNFDWNLLPSSPCINAGTPDTTGLNIGNTDLANNKRIYGDTIDIGAYESKAQSPFQGNLCKGESMILYAIPLDPAYLNFQWYFNELQIEGEVNNTLMVNPFTTSNNGTYYCEIYYANDTVLGNYSEVQMDSVQPIIKSQTLSVGSISLNDSICLYIDADFAQSYQWYLNGKVLTSKTDSMLIINPVTVNDTGNYYCEVINGCGNVNSQTIKVVGIELNNLNNEIKIFPNPVSNEITIVCSNLKINEINIFDITGKLIKKMNQFTNTINVTDLSNGTFFIKLITDKGTITKKFVKNK
jgi:parallel beta-helix repeat protein